jgi:dihydroorotase-like cyclic amidohydrolase
LDDIVQRMHTNPTFIFGLLGQPDTWIEVDLDHAWTDQASHMHSRCAWTPFEGTALRGKIVAVTLRGQLAYDGERVLAAPGTGRNAFGTV